MDVGRASLDPNDLQSQFPTNKKVRYVFKKHNDDDDVYERWDRRVRRRSGHDDEWHVVDRQGGEVGDVADAAGGGRANIDDVNLDIHHDSFRRRRVLLHHGDDDVFLPHVVVVVIVSDGGGSPVSIPHHPVLVGVAAFGLHSLRIVSFLVRFPIRRPRQGEIVHADNTMVHTRTRGRPVGRDERQ